MECYGLTSDPGEDWVCELCREFKENGKYMRCPLCTRTGGAMKPSVMEFKTTEFEIINPGFHKFLHDRTNYNFWDQAGIFTYVEFNEFNRV